MILPEDYGLGPDDTLAFTHEVSPRPEFDAFWRSWREELRAIAYELRLRRADETDPSDSGADHGVASVRNVQVGCRVVGDLVRAPNVCVVLHGAEVDPLGEQPEWERAVEASDASLCCVLLRVRGYAGSRQGAGSLAQREGFGGEGWITHGLESDDDWVVPLATADIASCVLAIRKRIGPERRLSLRGESLGGGLAVLAAAQLAQMSQEDGTADPIDRLILGLPSLGAWTWRAEGAAFGMGADLLARVRAEGERGVRLLERAGLCDSVAHAPSVRAPVICKLALRDEVVPAPTAAAVFNALGSEQKRAFVTPCGHFDSGIRNARRHALFERLGREWMTGDAPDVIMGRWADVLRDGDRPPPAPASADGASDG